MNRIQSLADRCDQEFETTLRIRRLLGEKIRRGKRSAEEVFRTDTGLVAAFATGVVIEQWRQSRQDAAHPGDGRRRRDKSVQWTSLLMRTALPYAIQGLSASPPDAASSLPADQFPA